jgi:hypothetical protein
MSDRALAIWGIAIGVVGVGLAVLGLWLAVFSSPWGTRNDQFCYQMEFGVSCFYTRANCEDEQRRAPMKITRECEREENPFRHGSN